MAQHAGCRGRVHVAIVGSGPSGFYAAEALLRSDQNVAVTMIERMLTPFDAKCGVVLHGRGRVVDGEAGKPVPGLCVTGWIKRGPSGIIGTNRADSIETVESMIADLDGRTDTSKPSLAALRALLAERKIRTVSIEDWRTIDAKKIERGQKSGKPRERFTRIEEMRESLS